MNAERVFTLEEVNALVPELSRIVEAQLLIQSEIEGLLAELARTRTPLPIAMREEPSDPAEVLALKRRLCERISKYNRGWEPIRRLGGVVKDPRVGMIDFYGNLDGRLVWLCWRFGERRVRYYHELDSDSVSPQLLRQQRAEAMLN